MESKMKAKVVFCKKVASMQMEIKMEENMNSQKRSMAVFHFIQKVAIQADKILLLQLITCTL